MALRQAAGIFFKIKTTQRLADDSQTQSLDFVGQIERLTRSGVRLPAVEHGGRRPRHPADIACQPFAAESGLNHLPLTLPSGSFIGQQPFADKRFEGLIETAARVVLDPILQNVLDMLRQRNEIGRPDARAEAHDGAILPHGLLGEKRVAPQLGHKVQWQRPITPGAGRNSTIR